MPVVGQGRGRKKAASARGVAAVAHGLSTQAARMF